MDLVGPLNPRYLGDLSPESAVERFRELLLCEARYAGLRPDAITISTRIHASDGGIDAQIIPDRDLPSDTFLRPGRMGIQLKTGSSFKPWQSSSLKGELVGRAGDLAPEVRRTLEEQGCYVVVCFGIDLTPEQRNSSREKVAAVFAGFGFDETLPRIDVIGQGQLASYFDRYPSLRLAIMGISDEGFLSVLEWSRHAHMANELALSDVQESLIQQIRTALRGQTKHVRLLGEPGIGKTRLALEALRAEDLCPITVYVPQGERFGQSQLFRTLLRSTPQFPLILVIDELSEREMAELWGHLKQRTGNLKLVSLDHGPGRTRDDEIVCLNAPRLSDDTIKAILASHVGNEVDIDRWVTVCEGSPRVAQAVGANLAANPDDILRPPATVPFWDRFLYGYATHNSQEAHQTATVMRHVALFSRFGFEDPVGGEARYIAALVEQADPAITWPRFQEIIQGLRARRVIQGTRTLFIVPWALHIYLWREYWRLYGRGFDFASMLGAMPESLHGWFLELFRYAHDSEAAGIVKTILRPNGIFSDRTFLNSRKGAAFLSALTEADPTSSLLLLENTIGRWSHAELLTIDESRQQFVRILEMIAVWRSTTVRALALLGRLALAENSDYANNATGTFLGLFRIGPEWAATEASPSDRLPALLAMLRSADPEFRRLGLKAAETSLAWRGGMRIIGAEYQGLKERASLWSPPTYGDWWNELKRYWDCLVAETRGWDDDLRKEANSAIFTALEGLLKVETLEDSAFSVLCDAAADPCTDTARLNKFLAEQIRRNRGEETRLRGRLRRLAGRLARQNLETRFQRYVIDVDWAEWEDYEVESEARENLRARKLVRCLAKRVAEDTEAFQSLLPLIVSANSETGALFQFGEALAEVDTSCLLLDPLLKHQCEPKSSQCIGGYLNKLRQLNSAKWREVLIRLLSSEATAPDGADLVWRSGFDEAVFEKWVSAYEHGWIKINSFRCLCFGMAWKQLPPGVLVDFLKRLADIVDRDRANILIDILDQILDENQWLVEPGFVLGVVSAPESLAEQPNNSHGFHWSRVCEKLAKRDPTAAMPLLDAILRAMENDYSLSYDHYIEPTAQKLCQISPAEAWQVVTRHLLESAPQWRVDILNWLKGGLSSFERARKRPPIGEFPLEMVMAWISEAPPQRASMIAHAAPPSLEEKYGGAITKALIAKYMNEDGVLSGIGASFHSGSWWGPESQYLRGKRDQLRTWLAQESEPNVTHWIEHEISYLDRRIDACETEEERESWNRPT